MKKYCVSLLFIVYASFAYSQINSPARLSKNDINDLKNSKIIFIENKGQWDKQVKYLTRINGLNTWITDNGAIFDFNKIEISIPDDNSMNDPAFIDKGKDKIRVTGHIVKMEFLNTSENNTIQENSSINRSIKTNTSFLGKEIISGYHNYFVGNDPKKWASNVPLYKEIIVKEIYEGISQRYYFEGNFLRYDFIVQPFADVKKIKMKYLGQDGLSINSMGELVIKTSLGDVINNKLNIFSITGSDINYSQADKKSKISGKFNIDKDGIVGFDLENYDRNQTIVIDPLIYSTYIGGAANADIAYSIATDASGNSYITGEILSNNFPTTVGAYDVTHNTGRDVYVTKLNTAGSSLVYSTYLGGSSDDYGRRIVLDAGGNAFITGYTSSTNFPVTAGSLDNTANGSVDAFVTKLNSTGTALSYSTYLGGSGADYAMALGVDTSGNAYIAGYTASTNFPAKAGSYDVSANGSNDIFVTKLNAAGSSTIYSTYVGGTLADVATSLFLDGSENVYVSGYTLSTNFPTTAGSFDQTFNTNNDVIVFRLNSSGNALDFSSYIGGSSNDYAQNITVDGSGNIYLTGYTASTNFPVSLGAYSTIVSGTDAFVTKLNSSCSSLIYSTYVGGSGTDVSYDIAVDASGNAYITGYTASTNFPLRLGVYDISQNGSNDVFLSKLNSEGTQFIYSTYIGGSGSDIGYDLELKDNGELYITGSTTSTNYPTTADAYSTARAGSTDIFITKFNLRYNVSGTVSYLGNPMAGVNVTLTGVTNATSTTDASGYFSILTDGGENFTLTLAKTGYCFTPSNVEFPFIISDQTQNFTAALNKHTISGSLTGLNGVSIKVDTNDNQGQIGYYTIIANGSYSIPGNALTTYTITPTKVGHSFTPINKQFLAITNDTVFDFSEILDSYIITVNQAENGVISPGTNTVNYGANQTFSITPMTNYHITSIKADAGFAPITDPKGQSYTFFNVTAHHTLTASYALDTFLLTIAVKINGAGLSGVEIYVNGAFIDTTDISGNLIAKIQSNSNITVTSKKNRYRFTPGSITLNNVNTNQSISFVAEELSAVLFNTSGLDFGNVAFQGDTAGKFVVIENPSLTKDLRINYVYLENSITPFEIALPVPTIIPAKGKDSIMIRFKTNLIGNFTDKLYILNNSAYDSVVKVSIRGNIIQSNLAININTVNFTATTETKAKDTITIQIRNNSLNLKKVNSIQSVITILDKNITGDTSFRFIKNNSNVVLNPGESDEVIIEFYPRTAGLKTATLVVNSNDPSCTKQYISLKGTGKGTPKISSSINIMDYGVLGYENYKEMTVSINNIGNIDLYINKVQILGNDSTLFTILTPVENKIMQFGESSEIKIGFSAKLPVGIKTAKLAVFSNDPKNNPLLIDLTALLKVPQLNRLPSRMYFNTITGIHTDTSIVIKNTGNELLKIKKVFIDGQNMDEFSFSGKIKDLQPADELTLSITFSPTIAGDKLARINIVSDDPTGNEFTILFIGFSKPVESLSEPLVISPNNCMLNQRENIVLHWTTVDLAKKYCVQLAVDSFKSNKIIIHDSCVTDTFRIINGLESNRKYLWRVKAKLSSVESDWSDFANFSTENAIPVKFLLLSPNQDEIIKLKYPKTDMKFCWRKSIDNDKSDNVVYTFNIVKVKRLFSDGGKDKIENLKDTSFTINLIKENFKPSADYFWYVEATDGKDTSVSDTLRFSTSETVSEVENIIKPSVYGLNQNYPNPFNPSTNITFSIPNDHNVKMIVYDNFGRLVRTLINNGDYQAGTYTKTWDGKDEGGMTVVSGIYFIKFAAGNYYDTKKMILVK